MLRAFEACCGALRSLEVARIQAAEEADDERECRIARAIVSLRGVISELRLASEGDSHAPAAGFVLASMSPLPNGDPGEL